MNFMRALATVSGLTLASRLAGFTRDILTAALLGAGPAADAFFVALKLPNLFRRLFAEGAFSVAFVPLFSGELETRGRAAALAFAEEALSVMVFVLVPFTVAAVACMPWLMVVLAPGFADEPGKYNLAVDLARLTFPYLMLISVVALLGGVLNSFHRFGPFAAAPIAFNLTLIAALLLAHATGWPASTTLAHGVALSGVVQLLWLAWACRSQGITLTLCRPRLGPRVRRLLVLMGPGSVGAGVMQINLFVDVILASTLDTGAVSYLYYAERLYQLPLGVIGIAVGTALLPVLSARVAADDAAGTTHYLSRGLEFSLLLALPATAGLMTLGLPIIQVLFERGAFGAQESSATAAAMIAYAVGIPGYVIVKVLSAGYFARQDTAGPVRVAIITTVANIALSLILIQFLAHVGIALATGVTAWLNVGLLAYGLRRRGHLSTDAAFRARALRLIAAAVLMGLTVGLSAWALSGTLASGGITRAVAVFALIGSGGLVYVGLCFGLRAVRLADLRQLLRRSKTVPKAAPEV